MHPKTLVEGREFVTTKTKSIKRYTRKTGIEAHKPTVRLGSSQLELRVCI